MISLYDLWAQLNFLTGGKRVIGRRQKSLLLEQLLPKKLLSGTTSLSIHMLPREDSMALFLNDFEQPS